MQAVILAGGKGTRLRPFTTSLPKPLVPLGDVPIIEVVLRQLRRYGFREVVISTGHLAELIAAFCGDGKRWGLKIRYVREDKPLSTAGALKLIRGLKSDFLTINGDVLTTLDFRKLYEFHKKQGAEATVAICERQTVVDFGVISVDGRGKLSGYTEKPAYRYLVSMGVNVFKRSALERIAPGEALGIPDLIARIREAGREVAAYPTQADWLDIGRPADYEAAQELFADAAKRRRYLPA